VKDFFVRRTVLGLIIPVLTVICVMLAGAGPALAAKKAAVQVGFVGVPPPGFQNVLLNVQSVRINPNVNAGPGSSKWQNIPTPPGIGGSGQNAELQIDLNSSQNLPQLFNTANVRVDTYRVAQIELDTNNPGTLIPNCPQAPPIGSTADGCINYPITLANGNFISVQAPTGDNLVAPGNGKTATLFLQVSMTITQAPTVPGGPYTVSIVLSTPSSPAMATINGTVNPISGSGATTSTTQKIRKLAVTAEAIGTGIPISTVLVKNNAFTLTLPAAPGPAPTPANPGFGTLYDLALAGGGDTYQAMRLVPVFPGTSLTPEFKPTTNQTLGNITGQLTDGCVATKPIIGAMLNLLIPPDSDTMPSPTFCLDSPEQCVTVATANTDNAGNFPLPGTIQIPAAFDNVPTRKQSNPYTLQITAPGYNTLLVLAVPSKNSAKAGGMCSIDGGTTFGACNLNMTTAYITGQIPIAPPPPGQTTLVQVFAEDHDTNNIESSLPMPVAVTSSNTQNGLLAYTINVPPSVPVFDLFATTIDLYQGVVDPFQGHNIVPISGIAAPAACATVTARTPSEAIECVGHGSITGSVTNPNLGTSVALEKLDPDGPIDDNEVQITSSMVQNQAPNPNPSSNYAFCTPADTYQLQRFQVPMPEPSVVPSAAPSPAPDGSPVSVTIPPPPLIDPSATPTPNVKCPTICSNPDGSCPGLCNNAGVQIP
jgi:hypothetical protein